jgi:hypothetical protein
MKSRILIALTAVFVMAFGVAVYAFNTTTNDTGKTAASCCAKKDSCPMKNKDKQTTAENHTSESCCDKADCCCKSGACPMKAGGEKTASDCCGNCCGGSCPMKNKQAETATVGTDKESCPHKTAGS